jgi:hypothetical protein
VFSTPRAAVQIAHGECIQTQVVVDDLEVDITVMVPGIVAILDLPTMGTLANLRRLGRCRLRGGCRRHGTRGMGLTRSGPLGVPRVGIPLRQRALGVTPRHDWFEVVYS